MTIQYLQKLCDVRDWQDDRFDHTVRHALQSTPTYQRKQWEFAMIHMALEARGVLHETSRGLAFGAGRERLVFSLANRVGHLLATDLYKEDSHWIGARTTSPKEWLLKGAPFPVDGDRLDAQFMDMNEVIYDGPPLDFCYSSCAFEHIGTNIDDFSNHLRLVKEILKNSGCYVLTTEFSYGDTLPYPHNFFFSLNDLLEIVDQSGLCMDPVLDLRLSPEVMNRPSIDAKIFGVTELQQAVVTPARNGRIFTSIQLVLTPQPAPRRPEILGYDGTLRWLSAQWQSQHDKLWRDWRVVSPFAGMGTAPVVDHDDHVVSAKPASNIAFHTAWLHFGAGTVHMKVALVAPGQIEEVPVQIVRRHVKNTTDREVIHKFSLSRDKQYFSFDAQADSTYAVIGFGQLPERADAYICARKL